MANKQISESRKALEKEYRTLAKRADQRLVRLERYTDSDFKTATKWAYARAQHDIKQWSGEGASRFNTAPPENDRSLMAKINDIKQFLSDVSSTKTGIIQHYKNVADSINQDYGTNFKWQDMGRFYDSEQWKNLVDLFGSDTAMRAVGAFHKNKKKVVKAIQQSQDVNITVEDEQLQSVIDNILESESISLEDLF